MNIAINARFLTQRVTGVQRYALELVRALDDLVGRGEARGCTFELLAPRRPTAEPTLSHIPLRHVGRLSGHAWEQLELPLHSRGRLLLNLCNAGPVATRQQVVTIHDAAVFAMPDGFSPTFRLWYQRLLPLVSRAARRVVTVSEFSRTELVKYCGTDPQKLTVIYAGAEQILRTAADREVLLEHGLDTKSYVFALGSRDPRKNFAALTEAALHLRDAPFDVVAAGGSNARVFQDTSGASSGHLRHLGYVSDAALRALYEGAGCFVYPSLYEGFGLPPLEAMACGCPVVAARAASLPEICGDAALYCDPRDPADIAAKVRAVMRDPDLRAGLRARGLARAGRFTWEACARDTVATLRKALS